MLNDKKLRITLLLILLILVGYTLSQRSREIPNVATSTPKIVEKSDPSDTTNPARERCLSLKGKIELKKLPYGSEYGLCNLEGGRACEEWSLFRGECPKEGVLTSGYTKIEDKYCVWRGGEIVVENASSTCYFRDGRNCNSLDYYKGKCVGL